MSDRVALYWSYIWKVIVLTALTVLSGFFTWEIYKKNSLTQYAYQIMIASLLVGFVFAVMTIYRKRWSFYTAPYFVTFTGVFAGTYSYYLELIHPHVTLDAFFLVYASIIVALMINFVVPRPPKLLEKSIDRASQVIILYYFLSMVFGFFNVNLPFLTTNDTPAILFSSMVIAVVTLRFLLNFDLIHTCIVSLRRNPEAINYMGWFSAFTMMTTKIWLFVEYLHLLIKFK